MLATVLATMAFVGIARAGQGLGWWHLSILATVIVSMLLIGTGALASSLVFRSWVRVPLAVTMAAMATFLLIAKPHLDGGVGERSVRPTTVEQAQTLNTLGIGTLTIDLRDVPLSEPGVTVQATVGIGRLHVIAPPGATLDLDVSVGAGHAVLDHLEIESGLRHDQQRTVPPLGESHGTIHLVLEIGMGELAVDRAA